jgi:hypothetical protein
MQPIDAMGEIVQIPARVHIESLRNERVGPVEQGNRNDREAGQDRHGGEDEEASDRAAA